MSNETNAIDPIAQACWEAGADPATITTVETAFYLGRCAAAVNAADAGQDSRDGPLADRLERERCAAIHQLRQAIARQKSEPAAVPIDPSEPDEHGIPAYARTGLSPDQRSRMVFFSNPDGVGDFGDSLLGTSAADTWLRCRDQAALMGELLAEHGREGLSLGPRATEGLTQIVDQIAGALDRQIELIEDHNEAIRKEGQQ